jgi:hypothetical protein
MPILFIYFWCLGSSSLSYTPTLNTSYVTNIELNEISPFVLEMWS